MPLVRVHAFCISLDGFGTGEGQSKDLHFGHAGDRLHQWRFATRSWQQTSGSRGIDNIFALEHGAEIGAEIMGAGKWGHPGWEDDPDWKGAWGPDPPFQLNGTGWSWSVSEMTARICILAARPTPRPRHRRHRPLPDVLAHLT